MRCILAGTVGVALGFGTVHSVAQEPGWRPAAVAPYSTAPVNPGLRAPAVTLGPPTVALGPPRALSESAPAAQGIVPAGWVARGKIDDKSPMPPGPALPGNQATPLPPPTPL